MARVDHYLAGECQSFGDENTTELMGANGAVMEREDYVCRIHTVGDDDVVLV